MCCGLRSRAALAQKVACRHALVPMACATALSACASAPISNSWGKHCPLCVLGRMGGPHRLTSLPHGPVALACVAGALWCLMRSCLPSCRLAARLLTMNHVLKDTQTAVRVQCSPPPLRNSRWRRRTCTRKATSAQRPWLLWRPCKATYRADAHNRYPALQGTPNLGGLRLPGTPERKLLSLYLPPYQEHLCRVRVVAQFGNKCTRGRTGQPVRRCAASALASGLGQGDERLDDVGCGQRPIPQLLAGTALIFMPAGTAAEGVLCGAQACDCAAGLRAHAPSSKQSFSCTKRRAHAWPILAVASI